MCSWLDYYCGARATESVFFGLTVLSSVRRRSVWQCTFSPLLRCFSIQATVSDSRPAVHADRRVTKISEISQ